MSKRQHFNRKAIIVLLMIIVTASFELTVNGRIAPLIGSVVRVSYAGKSQRRHILLSGGFRSQDSGRVYFGLGPVQSVDFIEIRKGQRTLKVEGPFKSARNYQIDIKSDIFR